jgi:hypothetical protein
VPDPDDELSTISYRAVTLGLPVVDHSGKQFGVVEHVLEVRHGGLAVSGGAATRR